MKVSIVTVVYNGASFIKSAIKSVLSQDYSDIEYIVIDGASTDGTMDIINQYKDQISHIISEPDQGIYDAMNKGVSLATGDVIGILNSDDFYSTNTVISDIVEKMTAEGVDSVYGNLVYVDPTNKEVVKRYWQSGRFTRKRFLYGWMPPHPTFFVRAEVYKKYGMFNLSLKSAADYEFMLRVLYKEKISTFYINKLITTMRDGGTSNISLKNRIRGNNEDQLAWKLNGLKPFFFTRYLKPLRKIWQFFRMPSD
ncbi:MAG: glycosyltransferase [Roseivirga sp.]|jgi:glycosyltransferase involved in cell wall biosynthesis|uniref:glycosyltransferase family 2 protein n=1 Tax=Roseivirga sp. TaxID=1964215 RepID=UPI001B022262|nr:glycosyltransferase family 2 protein [Roseivirga sp.]MBO6497566.1 glycosyltransferase [Roseivirga sp.]